MSWKGKTKKIIFKLLNSQKIVPVDTREWVYNHRLSQFQTIKGNAPIILLGDSLTENGEWSELIPGYKIINRGISGDTVEGILNRIQEIKSRKPELVIGMAGVNDIAQGIEASSVAKSICSIISCLLNEGIEVLWQSILYTAPPRNIDNQVIYSTNTLIKKYLSECGAYYLDVNQVLSDKGILKDEVSEDGLHLNGEGYQRWSCLLQAWLEQYHPELKQKF